MHDERERQVFERRIFVPPLGRIAERVVKRAFKILGETGHGVSLSERDQCSWQASGGRGLPSIWECRGKLRIRRVTKSAGPSCAASLAPPAEQRIGGGAVRGGPVAVRSRARDLRFEQRDPFIEFGLRIGTEILAGEVARCIARGPRQIGLVHWPEHRKGTGLLSIGKSGMRPVNLSG